MSLLGQFAPAVGAMMAQSKKLEVIGLNVANLNTGGYKRTETNFSTMLAQTYDHNRDIGGVRAVSRSLISQQGGILASDSNYDVAINGSGFFMLNSEIDGSGTSYYGRDGMMEQALGDEITITVGGNTVTSREGYLVDKNGYYVQGWPVNADGETFPTDAGSLQSLRIDPEAFTTNGEATTTAELGINLPSDSAPNYNESTFIKAYDSNGDLQSYQLKFTNYILGNQTNTVTPNWNVDSGAADNAMYTQDITLYNTQGFEQDVTLEWTKTPVATATNTWTLRVLEGSTQLNSETVTFDPATGAIVSPTSLTVATTATDGATFTLDTSSITQVAGTGITVTGTTIDGVKSQQIDNNWTMEVFDSNGTAIAIDSDTTPNRLQLTFNGDGTLASPLSVNIADTGGPSFALDISKITNYASGQIAEVSYDYNGRSDARLTSFSFNQDGEMIGRFSDATQRPIYKLPLATFTNPDALDPVNGNVYKYDPNAGEMVVRTASGQGAGVFVANAREISNVNLEDEFTKMIVTQNAYNTASTVIKTVDEMTEVARDLKA
ncbi:flagellar hook-basal body complex protein [Terasakiella sp. A23]|uniref:flagellar hook protein FlgE n=1 Tax=Terasakiella sp. FCG-A23 TaxID=3080561 RepID=UPI0029536AAE|nr:flagellar hook-basal body complex protein [Terasakiella sp. A23]MDV7339056.1 flagellar hook-basal body complex protein [Terasakiella sp. A23]